eukprot:3750452-Pyramimonas_sp.AAC.1
MGFGGGGILRCILGRGVSTFYAPKVVSRGSFSFLPPRNDKRPRYDAAGGAGGTVLQLHAPAEAARVSVRGECGARGRAGCVGGRRRPLEGRPNPPPHPPHHLPQPRPAP